MQNSIVLKIYHVCALVLLACGWWTGIACADTFHLTDGQTASGEIVSMDEKGIILKLPDGSYADRLPWTKLSQADLKSLQQNDKAASYVEPFIEPDPNEKLKKMEIDIKPVPVLARPPKGSLLGALFTSSLGIFTLLVLYAGNLYAAYEVSIFRAQPAGLVCGVAAVAPGVGPLIFLAMPTKLRPVQADWQTTAAQHEIEPALAEAIEQDKAAAAAHQADAAVAPAQGAAPAAAAPAPNQPPKPALPPTKTFARGQFTFNRRFFETQLAAFFAITRPSAEKDTVLTVKSVRGTYVVQRVSRATANELSLQIVKGQASEEVIVPFIEIQEVKLQHKDA
jgi:hypothetical protein